MLRPLTRRVLSCATHALRASSTALKPVGDENLPVKPIHFDVAARIEGEESHVATIQLRPGEVLRAESGAMVYMTDGISMDTSLSGASSAFQRFLTGQNIFITDYRYEGNTSGTVCLGTDFPSKILKFDLSDLPDQALICQRGAFLAANGPQNVNVTTEFTKTLSAGFFGGQGFILQRLSGDGQVLVKGGGTIVQRELETGETLRVTSGSIVAFESTLSYDIQMMPGVKNAMFGGEGLFVTTLSGPGRLWLQGMPPDRMISEIARRIPGSGLGFGIPLGGGTGGAIDEEAESVEGGEDASEAVAASDAAIGADRQATVASSGAMMEDNVDADSPSALFGDMAGDSPRVPDDSSSFDPVSEEPSFFEEDQFSTANETFSEPTFHDGLSSEDFSSDDVPNGELFDDSTSFSSEGSGVSGGDEEGGNSILSTLWSIFMEDDE